jgi:hypothetical protein
MEKSGLTVADIIEDTVDRLKTKPAVKFVNEGTCFSYQEMDEGAHDPVARRASLLFGIFIYFYVFSVCSCEPIGKACWQAAPRSGGRAKCLCLSCVCVMLGMRLLQANWGLAQGLRAGDVVALMMTNRPEFIVAWFAMAKLGVVTAFLNHNLRGTHTRPCAAACACTAGYLGFGPIEKYHFL